MTPSSGQKDQMSLLPDEIPVDDSVTGYDPEEDGYADTSFTLASTLHDFSYEHGRRYPSYRYGSHPFPHDDLSVKNDRILHHMMLYILDNRLFLAPVETPRHVLDVRCGEAFWAQNMADAYPDAHIVAMDTTPAPRPTFPNLSLMVQSCSDEWILDQPDMKFDFIYARNLSAHTNDFRTFYKQVFDNMEPGGYFEEVEIEINPRCDDNTSRPDGAIQRFASITAQMSSAFGTEYHIAMSMKDLIKEAGFVDIQETRMKLPLGPWSADPKYKQVGEWFEAFYKSGLQGWVLAPLTRNMDMSPETVNQWVEETFQEVDTRKQHLYFTLVIVHCRKPSQS